MAYPNPSDPLNIEAANMLNRDVKEFNHCVRVNVERFATPFVEKN